MTVVALGPDGGVALCIDDAGTRHPVEVALVAPLVLGDTVLVHAGVALVRLERMTA